MINIVFEGSPGAGKTTIIANIEKKLNEYGIKVGKTVDIDPTTPLYPILRDMNSHTPLVTSNEQFNTVLYETFLQVSDYVYSRERIIAQKNEINIFDRAYFSIYAYQKVLLEEKYGNMCKPLLKNLLDILKFSSKKIDIVFYFADKDNIYINRAQQRNNSKFTDYEIETLKLFEKELNSIVEMERNYELIYVLNENLQNTIDEILKKILEFYELRRK